MAVGECEHYPTTEYNAHLASSRNTSHPKLTYGQRSSKHKLWKTEWKALNTPCYAGEKTPFIFQSTAQNRQLFTACSMLKYSQQNTKEIRSEMPGVRPTRNGRWFEVSNFHRYHLPFLFLLLIGCTSAGYHSVLILW